MFTTIAIDVKMPGIICLSLRSVSYGVGAAGGRLSLVCRDDSTFRRQLRNITWLNTNKFFLFCKCLSQPVATILKKKNAGWHDFLICVTILLEYTFLRC